MTTNFHQNPEYLRNVAYRDANKLNARINFWKRYGSSQDSALARHFDLITAPANADVLEIGCGPGHLWQWGLKSGRVPSGWKITLTDLSEGMIDEARSNIGADADRFQYRALNAADLPFDDGSFDLVVANYMLYHVPDPAHTVAEIHRVLKPSGQLHAATNSDEHIKEITELQRRFTIAGQGSETPSRGHAAFSLESSRPILASRFGHVETHTDASVAQVDSAQLLVDYLESLGGELDLDALRSHIEEVIERDGFFPVTRSTGVFVATR